LNFAELLLGVLTAVGGFVDVSELIFVAQGGSRFGYALIWVMILATGGIMVFGEMSGRVAAIAKQPVFNLMRHRLGLRLGLVTLVASIISNTIICAAEIGGVALVVQLLTGLPYPLLAVLAALFFVATVWILPFKWIERTYGLLGLAMLTFAAALVAIHPPWADIAAGAVPQIPQTTDTRELLAYAYFFVALMSAVMFPYETYFYSSGGIEDGWSAKDLLTNRVTTIFGFAFGSLVAIAVMCTAAQLFGPAGISPDLVGTAALQGAVPFGRTGLLLALLGMFFAFAGAAIETCLANAYSVSQFFGWRWGRHCKPWDAPRFTWTWIVFFAVALLIVLTGVYPVQLAEYAVVSSILVLPLTYLPLLMLAGDKSYMGSHANGLLAKSLGWIYYVLIVVAAVAAVPLYLLTSGGKL
jgi:Mn2+/Fe2+ NRAMP family transporter